MADITKCAGGGCVARLKCWRYLSPAQDRQSWFARVPGKDAECEHYWPAHQEEQDDE